MMDQKADPGNPKSWPRFILRVDRYMCTYLTSGKRTRIAILTSSLKVWVLLKVCHGVNFPSLFSVISLKVVLKNLMILITSIVVFKKIVSHKLNQVTFMN